jgi:mannobiose 2-epimerase
MDSPLAYRARTLGRRLADGVLPYWFDTAVDRRHGGFVLADDGAGGVAANDKDLVAQSRLIWVFSHAHLNGIPATAGRDYLAAAAQGVRFLREHFLDREHGGYFWSTDLAGRALNTNKILYGQAFALYALVEYHRAAGDPEALAAALDLAGVLAARAHDERHRGWREHFRRDWTALTRRAPGAPVEIPGLKSANTHLHMMEALAELCAATGDPGARGLLEETREINATWFFPPDPRAASLHRHADWRRVLRLRSQGVSYGHNVEYAWLLLRAEAVLGRERSWGLLHAYLDHALRCGFDWGRGGLAHAGIRDWLVYDRRRVWWVQAELLAALTDAIGDRAESRYLLAVDRLLGFVEDRLADPRDGVWIMMVDARGRPLNTTKASNRKAAYHEVRAIVKFSAAFGTPPPSGP